MVCSVCWAIKSARFRDELSCKLQCTFRTQICKREQKPCVFDSWGNTLGHASVFEPFVPPAAMMGAQGLMELLEQEKQILFANFCAEVSCKFQLAPRTPKSTRPNNFVYFETPCETQLKTNIFKHLVPRVVLVGVQRLVRLPGQNIAQSFANSRAFPLLVFSEIVALFRGQWPSI